MPPAFCWPALWVAMGWAPEDLTRKVRSAGTLNRPEVLGSGRAPTTSCAICCAHTASNLPCQPFHRGGTSGSLTCHLKVSLFSNAVPALPTHPKSRDLRSRAWPLARYIVQSTREACATARGAQATCICYLWPPLSCSSRQERRAGRLRRGRSSPSPPARRQHPHGAFLYHPHGVTDRCQLLRLRASLKRGASCL